MIATSAVAGHCADLVVHLTGLAVTAQDVPSAVTPMLETFVRETAAEGSAYFQLGDGSFLARAATGVLPTGPAMDAILAHGLPERMALMEALRTSGGPMFFDDTAASSVTDGFPDLGVASLVAAPVRDRQGTLLGAFLMHTFEPHGWTEDEASLVGVVSGTLAALTARLVAEESALAAREGAIRAIGLALDTRDGETKGHTDRVTTLALALADILELGEDERAALRYGAYLHDVGKIGIPDAILLKPGRLDDAEWSVMRRHTIVGQDFARELAFLSPEAMTVIRHHHERWDGAGYPDGLAGDRIPLAARIFAVCDVYDALRSERPYKAAWTHDEAIAEIALQSGTQFDPRIVATFVAFAPGTVA